MGRSAAEEARLQSVVLASIEYMAGKRVRREHLDAGSETRVQGVINATVGRARIELPFARVLSVGHEQTSASSSKPDETLVVAWLLDQLPESERDSVLARLPEEFARLGTLPSVTDKRREQAEELLKRLRSSKTVTKRGAVVFAQSEPAAA